MFQKNGSKEKERKENRRADAILTKQPRCLNWRQAKGGGGARSGVRSGKLGRYSQHSIVLPSILCPPPGLRLVIMDVKPFFFNNGKALHVLKSIMRHFIAIHSILPSRCQGNVCFSVSAEIA